MHGTINKLAMASIYATRYNSKGIILLLVWTCSGDDAEAILGTTKFEARLQPLFPLDLILVVRDFLVIAVVACFHR